MPSTSNRSAGTVFAAARISTMVEGSRVPRARPAAPVLKPNGNHEIRSSGDVKLSELNQFSDWMQRVVQAIQSRSAGFLHA